jgi:GNAT superfamily N-acetyltransferase
MVVRIALTDAEITGCYPVMAQLRPHVPEEEFVAMVRTQMDEGYELAWIADNDDAAANGDSGPARAVAGFRVYHNLFRGLHMYVDDLVTDKTARSGGYGGSLLEWLAAEAKRRDCVGLDLDSGVQRFDAHRFYFRQRMTIAAYHFVRSLED